MSKLFGGHMWHFLLTAEDPRVETGSGFQRSISFAHQKVRRTHDYKVLIQHVVRAVRVLAGFVL